LNLIAAISGIDSYLLQIKISPLKLWASSSQTNTSFCNFWKTSIARKV